LRSLVLEGQRAVFSRVESVRRCTQISRTLEEILHRFEYGDLRPAPGTYRRPKSSRGRPPPTSAQMKSLRAGSERRPTRTRVKSVSKGQRKTSGVRARAKSTAA
jgi:hypothetical protein